MPASERNRSHEPERDRSPEEEREVSRQRIFWLQIVYLFILLAAAFVYSTWLHQLHPPRTPISLGPVPIGVPWFGALGAVLISLTGVFQHIEDWDPLYKYWHWSRPMVGATVAVIAVLIFQAGMFAVGSTPPSGASGEAKNYLYYIIAFLVGYREETFRELIKRVTDVVLTPAPPASPPIAKNMGPATGPVGGGTQVTIGGQGLTGVTAVRFGARRALYRVDSDEQLTATSPSAESPGPVSVVVTGKGGSSTVGQFTYHQ